MKVHIYSLPRLLARFFRFVLKRLSQSQFTFADPEGQSKSTVGYGFHFRTKTICLLGWHHKQHHAYHVKYDLSKVQPVEPHTDSTGQDKENASNES